jgi:hypothetical protein
MTEEQKYFRFNGIELKKENDKLMLNTLIQSPSEEDMENIKKMDDRFSSGMHQQIFHCKQNNLLINQ